MKKELIMHVQVLYILYHGIVLEKLHVNESENISC